MDEKTGVESPPVEENGGESTSNDHEPVARSISVTSRKNNTGATQNRIVFPRGNDNVQAQTAPDLSTSLPSDTYATPPDANAPGAVLGVKKLGTESLRKAAESQQKDAAGTDDSTVSAPNFASGTSGVTTKQVAQTANASAQGGSVLPSLLSTASTTPPIQKSVSFSNNVDVAIGIIKNKDSGIQLTSSGASNPPPAVEPIAQMPLNPQAVTPMRSSDNPIPGTQLSDSADLMSVMRPVATFPGAPPEPSFDETIRRLRAPLVDTYSPFISPSDTSLSAARERLKTALEQTRRLRSAFTERVYEKYRVILRPVQPSIDPMIERMKSNPAEVSGKLKEEIRMIKKEKDIEKKEAQKLHAAVAANTATDGSTFNSGINAQETAEQLAWFGAGLNIVILPEEDIDDDIDTSEYPHRGPTNPETGQRVSGISAAAATAAETLLDRVRRGGAMRMERQRRRQLQLLSGEDADAEPDGSSILSHLHLLSSSSVGRIEPAMSSSTASGKTMKHGAGGARGSPPHAASKAGRARSQVSLSGTNLLSLNPQAEELTPHGEPSTAATAALISKGTGSATNRTIQQRWRHPHPESLGGQRLALTAQSSGKKLESARAAVAPMAMSEYVALALPPLPTAKERKESKPVDVLDVDSAATERGRTAVHCVLHQFFCSQENAVPASLPHQGSDSPSSSPGEKEAKESRQQAAPQKDTDSPVTATEREEPGANAKPPANLIPETKRKKFLVTEIGLLRGMQQTREQADATLSERAAPSASTYTPASFQVPDADPRADTCVTELAGADKQPIDPIIAFSVLHALGLVQEKTKSPQEQGQSILSCLQKPPNRAVGCETKTAPKSASDNANDSVPEQTTPSARIQKLVSRKRLFSEAFSLSQLDGASKTQTIEDHQEPCNEKTAMNVVNAIETQVPSKCQPENEKNEENQSEDVTKSEVASIRGGGQAMFDAVGVGVERSEVVAGEKTLNDDPGLVPSIRGGGEALGDSSDESSRVSKSQEDPSASHSATSTETSLSPQTSSAQEADTEVRPRRPWGDQTGPGLTSHLTSLSRSTSSPASFSPTRNAAANGLRMQRPHSSSPSRSVSHTLTGPHERFQHARVSTVPLSHTALHHPPGASMGRPLAPGELPEYFGSIQPHGGFVAPQHEWSSLGAAAAGLLPTHSSLAALGINQHRAAMVSLSVRERAARVLLAREQAAAAHRHAAAVTGGARVSSLSPQQAAVFMGTPTSHTNAGLYRQTSNPNTTYGRLGPHSVASARGVMSSPANSPLVGANTAAPAAPRTSRLSQRTDLTTATLARTGGKNDELDEVDFDGSDLTRQMAGPSGTASSRSTGTSGEQTSSPNLAGSTNEDVKAADVFRDQRGTNSSPVDLTTNSGEQAGTTPEGGNSPHAVLASSLSEEQEEMPAVLITSGMRFLAPSRPAHLSKDLANSVLQSRIHVAYGELSSGDTSKQALSKQAASLIEYLLAVGAAVPIPKALVSNPLKERLNTPGFKSPGNGGSPTIPREVVVAAILVWLWAEHRDSFQRAFARSGRIDVDPECKWLILASVDAAVRALMLEIADSVARGGPLAAALNSNRNKPAPVAPKSAVASSENNPERLPGTFPKLDIQIASIVSEALMTELCINEEMDITLPHFEALVKQLDECRLSSLRAKSRERALLAALISRRATMSEPFSHAYVSSMVRSGEALGHEELFEVVQDEETATSTMIPYDIFSDDTGAWEDPCRVSTGFTPSLTGDDLTRRAHARAMIQKSLKKLQDRHNIRGGTPTAGPYSDPPPATDGSGTGASPNTATESKSAPALQRTNSGLKRKASFSLGSDTPVPIGSGSAPATSSALYRPNHHSAPLIWDCDAVENLPYGRYVTGPRKRSLSLGRVGFGNVAGGGGKKARFPRTMSVSLPSSSPGSDDASTKVSGVKRSTEEIDWTDVAGIFQPVSKSAPATPTGRKAAVHQAPAVVSGRTIIAPFCRRIEDLPEDSSTDDDSEKEDLSDAAILARHRVVLDEMKTKLEKYMVARSNAQQRSARRSSSKLK